MSEGADPQSQSSRASDVSYNKIFEELVGPDSDSASNISGLIAYSLYKVSKREWVSDFRIRRGRRPSSEELDEYTRTWTKTRIEGLKNDADQALAVYSSAAVEQAKPAILREALKGRFWPTVGTNVFSNLTYTVLLIVVAVVLARAGVDIVGIYRSIEGK